MNKVKIMLLSLFVLATAGGTMALKVKFLHNYCVTSPLSNGQGGWVCQSNPSFCVMFPNVTTTNRPGVFPYCITSTNPATGDCEEVTNCNQLAKLIQNG